MEARLHHRSPSFFGSLERSRAEDEGIIPLTHSEQKHRMPAHRARYRAKRFSSTIVLAADCNKRCLSMEQIRRLTKE